MSQKLLLQALRCEPVTRTPVWLMRQAGRVLPEYRRLKEEHGFVKMATTPELAAQVTLQPIQRFHWDGAILFADILSPLMPMDFGIDFQPGPKISRPLVGTGDANRVRLPESDELSHVSEAIRLVRASLPADVAMLGFAGAPFTLAAYLFGSNSRDHSEIRRMVYGNPSYFREVLERLADLTIAYLQMQIEAGAEAVQLFDTWGGLLGRPQFRTWELPVVQRIFRELPAVPKIYLVKDGAHLLEDSLESGAQALGLDWRVLLDDARKKAGPGIALQGNLDPAALLGEPEQVRLAVREILDRNRACPGHIFNLGHGLLPSTPLENLSHLLAEVRKHARTQVG